MKRSPIRTFLRIVGWGALGLLTLALVGLAFLYFKPVESRPASAETVERTPERIARGQYLFHHVALCADCHSEHDTSRFGMPVVAERIGAGQCVEQDGRRICYPNITPHPTAGVGKWTDGELMRAIREGVDREGRALVNLMPFSGYRHMSDEDVRSIVAYLRTLPPKEASIERTPLSFMEKLLVKLSPEPLDGPVPEPTREDAVAYGAYLTQVGVCAECHMGMEDQPFAGGIPLPDWRGRTSVAANLTPHPTALGSWTREAFLQRFKVYSLVPAGTPPPPGGSVMPWAAYAGLTDEDLSAIYAYLRTVPPVPRAPEEAAARP